MRKRNVLFAILSTASLGLGVPAQASEIALDYYLPRATIGFGVSHTITGCPESPDKNFTMDTVTAIKPVYTRGEWVRINPKGNWVVDREVKLEYYEDRTLKSFNGSSKGQGGKLAAAAIKTATFAATALKGVPAAAAPGFVSPNSKDDTQPPRLQCKEKIVALLAEQAAAEAMLAELKRDLVQQGASEQRAKLILSTQAAIDTIKAELTVSAKPFLWSGDSATNFEQPVPQADLTVWFDWVQDAAPAPYRWPVSEAELQAALNNAGLGQVTAFKAKGVFAKGMADADKPICPKPTPGKPKPVACKALVYRVPTSVKVELVPSLPFVTPADHKPAAVALARAAYEATKAEATVKVPQVGGRRELRFDGSGMFASRSVSAAFDRTGELTAISFSNTGIADNLAGLVDPAIAGLTAWRDDRVNDIQRDIARRTAENNLADLIEAEAKAKADAAAAP